MKSISYLVVTAMIFGAILTSCNESDNDDNQREFTVTFDSNGGSIVKTQKVKAGEKVAELEEDPKLIGHAFMAWYKEDGLTSEWKFDTDVVTADTTLYAKWIPKKIINPVVENLPGGARISYTFPDDVNFFRVEAEYYINGNQFISSASYYVNSVEVMGFGATDEQIVLLYSVDRHGNHSEPVSVKIHPTTPPVLLIRESMTMNATFGGICIYWKNEHKSTVTINLIAANENGDLVPTPWRTEEVDTNEAEGEYCWRGFDNTERLFGVFVRDRWYNYSDTLLVVFTPLVDL